MWLKQCQILALALWCLLSVCTVSARTVEIGVLVDYINDDMKPLFFALEKEISLVIGNDAKIVMDPSKILVNNFETDIARNHYQALINGDADIILAFGPVAYDLISQQSQHKKPTIVFGAVNLDLLSIDTKKSTSGVHNFTYILVPWSYRKDLQDFKSIYPFKRVAVLGAFDTWDTPESHAYLDQIFADLDAQYKRVQYHSVEQVAAELDDVDAVYLAEGFGIPYVDIQALGQVLINKQLPSFTSTRIQDVQAGWLATNQADTTFEQLFRRIALSVEAVVDGRNLAERPVFMDLADTITVNYNTAEKIGVPIRFSQIATIDLVGSFDEFVADRSYSVIEAVELALQNNLALKAARLDVELAHENLASAKTAYYPDLALTGQGLQIDPDLARLSGGANPERTLSGAATISQTLYSEESSAAIGSQKNLLKAQEEIYQSVLLDTVLNTTRASFDLLRRKNALRSQSENLEITQRNLRVAQQNFSAGQASRADILRFRSELATNMQRVIDALNDYQQARHALNAILHNPIGDRIEIKEVKLEGGPFEPEGFGYSELSKTLDDPTEQLIFQDFLIQQAMQVSPELAALEFNLKAVERDMAQYGWRRFIPTVSASAQYNRVFDRSGVGIPDPNIALDSDYNVGVVFSIPIFNRNVDNVSLRRAKRQFEQLELQLESQRQAIETGIRNRVLEVSARIANIELSEVSETAALQSLELTEASYASGAATITDLIDSQNNYLQAQLASSNALYNFIDSAVEMEREVGIFLFIGNTNENLHNFSQDYRRYRKTVQSEGRSQ